MGQLDVYSALDNRLRADGDGNILVVTDEEAVGASIENILLTRRGERPMRRNFGTGMLDLLFEPVDDTTAGFMKLKTLQDIPANGEDRLIIEGVTIADDPDNGRYDVSIPYRLKSLPGRRFEFRRIFRATGDVT